MNKNYGKKFVTLNNGIKMPILGFGSVLETDVSDFDAVYNSAWNKGYRLFDTASNYGNQIALGNWLQTLECNREEYWLTSKVAQDEQGYEQTLAAFQKTLKELQTDYLDLYLIHWPKEKTFFETWKAMEELYDEGLVRAIGVSNFEPNHIDRLLTRARIMPAVDQVETHPYFSNHVTHDYLKKLEIQPQAWSPLGHGGQELNDNKIIELAQKYHKSVGQIILRWLVQKGVTAIPKSTNFVRQEQNISIFDWSLTPIDEQAIDELQKGERVMGAPDENYTEDKW
ncbi:aldo/keto reductase [Lactococcus allomyrinae]|uniref:Aldo/keto reductase n=1 Tax=Lactococcus allomyrinae TaxID=2419773 RepID=A0A387BGZ5_9LACT|nr:aldo/keto reductase [Lactococcus allomyrinae]AYG00140.1 aldo/keto reductase [Lactococcus allomyrinae]